MADSDTPQPTVLLCKWKEELVRTFLGLGCRLYLVLDDFDLKNNNPPADLLDAAEGVYRVPEFDSLDAVATVAADLKLRGERIDHIVSHAEYSQFGAGYLDILLRRGGAHPFGHVALRDKRLMKAAVRKAGIPAAAFVPLTSAGDLRGAAEAARTLQFPAVLKPATGLGTLSTTKVARPEDLLPALQRIDYSPKLKSRQLSVEEFVEGREYHVDAFWVRGNPVYLAVGEYCHNQLSLVSDTGKGGRLLDGSRIVLRDEDPALYEDIAELHHRVNKALSVTDGNTHLEVFRKADGSLVFSEMAGRIGGGWLPLLLTQYLGRSVWEVIARGTLGETGVTPAPAHTYLGGFALAPDAGGTIAEVPGEAEALACPGVLSWKAFCKPGDTVPDHTIDRRSAFIVVGADSLSDYEKYVEEAHRRLTIKLA
ncbi:ATP-grasp domain-containing protein [Streptomyces sp. HPF1205]|uniref:ATP-grasp domain-containing protein n=1 Tax=Streptomyces sp. HPF1205 TaxID=2873262 RepID=UPI001CEC9C83|nr:ATP-grasp domain-containing protein [Streptomyces sp. HPF1205]